MLTIHRPDATATFTALIITVLGLVATAAGTFHALGRQGEKLDKISSQTNGTLSKLLMRNAALAEENASLRAALPHDHPLNQKETAP